MAALLEEAERLKKFAAKNARVPQVLGIAEGHIVLADCGLPLPHFLKTSNDQTTKHEFLERIVANLSDVHNAGLIHGRPHLKDMMLDEEGLIYLLDLEEDPLKVMNFEEAQARDVWLLLSSCAQFCENPFKDLKDLLALYLGATNNDIRPEIAALARSGRQFRRAVSFFHISNVGRDVFGVFWATKVFETLISNRKAIGTSKKADGKNSLET